MKTRGADGRFRPTDGTPAPTPEPTGGSAIAEPADSQRRIPSSSLTFNHAAAAADLLHSAEDGALPPSLRIEAAQAHAFLALVDELRQLHATIRDRSGRG